jgi:Flp pilus assembly protein TadG
MRGRRGSRGQALLEFSLIIPIFLVMLMGIVDVGRAIWAQNSLAAAAREGARFAIVHGGSDATLCPVGPTARTDIPAASASCPYPSPSRQAIKDAVMAAANAGGTSLTVTVCYGAGCSGDVDAIVGGSSAVNSRNTPVTVAVTSQINLITPSLLGMSGFGISSATTMLVNN